MRILIAAGGTGGHIFPAVTLAKEIESRGLGNVLFVISSRPQDKGMLVNTGIPFRAVPITPLKSKNILSVIVFAAMLLAGTIKSFFIILGFRPDTVVGFGGYVTGPMVLLASFLGIKTIIHEQNVYPGRANTMLARFAGKIAVSFEETIPYLKKFEQKIIVSGNPIRRNLKRNREAPQRDNFVLLVTGGSQGAHRLNEAVPAAIGLMDEGARKSLEIIHVSGENDKEAVAEKYKNLRLSSRVFSFTEDMDKLYNECDFVIARAGAMTVSELLTLGIPSILIPYPYAGAHQMANAKVLGDMGGAIVIKEDSLDDKILKNSISKMLDRDILRGMSSKIENIKRFDACGILIKYIL